MKLLDRMRRLFRGGKVEIRTPEFERQRWARTILDDFKDSMIMSGLGRAKEEPVCPLTKQLIVQQLQDLAVKHPTASMREIIAASMEDGVKDDHELLEKLNKLESEDSRKLKRSAGDTIKIRMAKHAAADLSRKIDDHVLDALKYGMSAQKLQTAAMRQLVDNVKLTSVKPVQSAGCADPAGKTGSGAG